MQKSPPHVRRVNGKGNIVRESGLGEGMVESGSRCGYEAKEMILTPKGGG